VEGVSGDDAFRDTRIVSKMVPFREWCTPVDISQRGSLPRPPVLPGFSSEPPQPPHERSQTAATETKRPGHAGQSAEQSVVGLAEDSRSAIFSASWAESRSISRRSRAIRIS